MRRAPLGCLHRHEAHIYGAEHVLSPMSGTLLWRTLNEVIPLMHTCYHRKHVGRHSQGEMPHPCAVDPVILIVFWNFGPTTQVQELM